MNSFLLLTEIGLDCTTEDKTTIQIDLLVAKQRQGVLEIIIRGCRIGFDNFAVH